jgi:hypothetical protein
MFVYYADGSSSQWIPAAPAGQTGATGADGTDGTAGYATVVTDMAGLIAITGMVAGQTALVTALNKVFMYTGSAWYLIATMTNASPTAITGVNSTYDLAIDGTATTITAVSTDPEGFALTWSYAVTAGSLGSTASVSQADNVFTITPSTTEADAGTFSITFSVTDGATGAVSAVSAFTLAFAAVLPTSGLTGLYDMKDNSSYSGSGTTWADISGNSGPNLTIDASLTTYNSSGIGGIPSLTLAVGANAVSVGPTYPTGLTDTSSPYDGTVVMIFAKPTTVGTAQWPNDQEAFYLFSASHSQGLAVSAIKPPGGGYADTAIYADTATWGSWPHRAATLTSKIYIDGVYRSTLTQGEAWDAFSSTANVDKYHSFAVTNGHFLNGWSISNPHPALAVSHGPIGELRALVFYDRALTSSEVATVHDYFAGDYSSSEMIQ